MKKRKSVTNVTKTVNGTRKENVVQKLLVLQLYSEGINPHKISTMTGISDTTIRYWLNKDNTEFISLNKGLLEHIKKTLELTEQQEIIDITELKHDIIKQLQTKVNDGSMSGSQLGVLYGIIFDKQRILQGKNDKNSTISIEVMIKQAIDGREQDLIKEVTNRVIDTKPLPVKDIKE